mmetsp:Transcript_43558/g.72577  ORF Transcript_43558/g.72577 Transcript_43558/m.72577 type:complete len:222 (-) Transcript_43558:243-908(-)
MTCTASMNSILDTNFSLCLTSSTVRLSSIAFEKMSKMASWTSSFAGPKPRNASANRVLARSSQSSPCICSTCSNRSSAGLACRCINSACMRCRMSCNPSMAAGACPMSTPSLMRCCVMYNTASVMRPSIPNWRIVSSISAPDLMTLVRTSFASDISSAEKDGSTLFGAAWHLRPRWKRTERGTARHTSAPLRTNAAPLRGTDKHTVTHILSLRRASPSAKL